MTDIVKLYQFRKVSGKTVKLPDEFIRVLRKHDPEFKMIHKKLKDVARLLAKIHDDSNEVCLKAGNPLPLKAEWIKMVMRDISKDIIIQVVND